MKRALTLLLSTVLGSQVSLAHTIIPGPPNLPYFPVISACNGSGDDTSAINAAITLANANGGIVQFPGKGSTCVISSTLAPSEGVILQGGGPSTTVFGTDPTKYGTKLKWAGALNNGVMIQGVDGSHNWGVRDLNLDGNDARQVATGVIGIEINQSRGVVIENVGVENVGWCFYWLGTAGSGSVGVAGRYVSLTCNDTYNGFAFDGGLISPQHAPVTDLAIYQIFVNNFANAGVVFFQNLDDIAIFGGYIQAQIANSTAVVFNPNNVHTSGTTLPPSTILLEGITFSGAQGVSSNGILCNDTGSAPVVVHALLYAILSNPTVNAGCVLDFTNLNGPATNVVAPYTGARVPAGSRLNRIRNPGMEVAQRGTGNFSITTSAYSYTVDGWVAKSTGANTTCLQGSSLITGGGRNSLRCDGTTGVTDLLIKQPIESYWAGILSGQTVTLQFRYQQDTGSAVTPKISTCVAATQDNFSTCNADLTATSLSSCASATICLEAYTFVASANAVNGYEIKIDCNAAFPSGKHCWVSDVDLRVTSNLNWIGINVAPPPTEIRPFDSELLLNARYYYRRNAALNPDYMAVLQAYNLTSAFGQLFNWPTLMRANPTVSFSNATHFSLTQSGSGVCSVTSIGGFQGTTTGVYNTAGITGSGCTLLGGNATQLFFNTLAGWLDASAELTPSTN